MLILWSHYITLFQLYFFDLRLLIINLILLSSILCLQGKFVLLIILLIFYIIYYLHLKNVLNYSYLNRDLKISIVSQCNKYMKECNLLSEILNLESLRLKYLNKNMHLVTMQNILKETLVNLKANQIVIKPDNVLSVIHFFAKKFDSVLYLSNKEIVCNKVLLQYILFKFANIPTYHSSILSSNKRLFIAKFEYDFAVSDLQGHLIDELHLISNILKYININVMYVKNAIILEIPVKQDSVDFCKILSNLVEKLLYSIDEASSYVKQDILDKLHLHNVPTEVIAEVLSCDINYVNEKIKKDK